MSEKIASERESETIAAASQSPAGIAAHGESEATDVEVTVNATVNATVLR